jgi:hypothetical protein
MPTKKILDLSWQKMRTPSGALFRELQTTQFPGEQS